MESKKDIGRDMKYKENSSKPNIFMRHDDWMEGYVDQFLKYIETSEEIPSCTPSSQFDKVGETLNLIKIKDTFDLTHDHMHMFVALDSSESVISMDNETLCGFFQIPIVVMSGSHSSTFYLNSDVIKNDHVALSSLVHHDIPCKDDEDLEDAKGEIMIIPRKISSFCFPMMESDDSCSNILETCFKDITNKIVFGHET